MKGLEKKKIQIINIFLILTWIIIGIYIGILAAINNQMYIAFGYLGLSALITLRKVEGLKQ